MNLACRRVALLIGILLGMMVVCGCASPAAQPQSATAPPAPTTHVVTLSCQDCADAGTDIRIWISPDRSGVAGGVPHNTPATVVDTTAYNGVLHYKVQVAGITGWVSYQFVQE